MAKVTKSVNISRRKNGEYTAKFKEKLTIDFIHAINEEINVIFDDAKRINLDLAAVNSIDLSGIQLISHIIKRCKERKTGLHIKKPFVSDIIHLLEKTGFESLVNPAL